MSGPLTPRAAEIAERVARDSYGRLLAYLAARWRDLPQCEDALSEAFASALAIWAREGVPSKPEAWLLTVARRRIVDRIRHAQVTVDASGRLALQAAELEEHALSGNEFPDDRLKLMFVCAHPAIDAAARAPLMLQTVLGLDAERIAAAFLVPPATMSQRLVRAKSKIRDAGIAFENPDVGHLAERVGAVLDAVYAAYALGHDSPAHETAAGGELVQEAVWLSRVTSQLLPNDPEAQGLLALVLFIEARRTAERRETDQLRYRPLAEQDCTAWQPTLIAEAEALLKRAAEFSRPGRFQLEAAIQSVHADRRRTGITDWQALRTLYDGLIHIAPTIGACVARAAVVGKVSGPEAGLAQLATLADRRLDNYQPYWAVRASLEQAMGDAPAAIASYDRATALTDDPGVREYLARQRSALDRT